MAPFPETEIMTIKRLEVALRKSDYKLLKDGAYKLHEKFHGGHCFEYIDLLKEISNAVSQNPSIPHEVKNILIPTINDILASKGVDVDEEFSRQRVSSLTSLSYTIPEEPKEEFEQIEQQSQYVEQNISVEQSTVVVQNDTYEQESVSQETVQNNQEQEPLQPEKIDAFSAFGSASSQSTPRTFAQSPFSAQPFKEFTSPAKLQETPVFQPQPTPVVVEQVVTPTLQTSLQEPVSPQTTFDEVKPEVKKEIKPVAIFFNQNSTQEKNRNILALREEISKIDERDISLNKILNLIAEINIQTNVDVSPLQSILEQVKDKENRINLITNSQSANLVELFKKIDLNYSFLMPKKEKNVNLIPLLGLSNLFVCSECGCEYLDDKNEIAPLALQCPKCRKPMFASLYAIKGVNSEINLNYYNNSILSLVNSKIWVLITPSLEDRFSINILRNALKISNSVEEIYILDKDINVKEQYRNMFYEINENVKVDIQTTALEEFLNSIR